MRRFKMQIYMEKPWLVQRLQKPYKRQNVITNMINSLSFGGGLKHGGLSEDDMKLIQDIFRFDYMGSAEFEWGAIPTALNRIIKNHGDYIAFEMLCNTKEGNSGTIYVICHHDICEGVKKWIEYKSYDEYDKKYMTKEHVLLQNAINDGGGNRICGWLELDNGFFFFTNKEMFEKTRELFGVDLGVELSKC